MGIENRTDYIAAQIQAEADGWTPQRLAAREGYRTRVMNYIAGLAIASCMTEKPVDIGYDDNEMVS